MAKTVSASPAGVVGHTSHASEIHDREARRHRLAEVRIEPADNKGFTVTHRFKAVGKGADAYSSSKPDKRHVFANAKDMHKHIAKTFTASDGGDTGASAKGEMKSVEDAE